jgi:hypothetical protein
MAMKSVVKFDRISISIDVTFVRMISHFPLFLPTLRDLVANVMHRLWYCMVEFRPTGMLFIYYKYRNGPKTYPWDTPDSKGTLILSPSIIILHPISYFYFYLWRSREWLTLSSVLEIVHYYDLCPFTIFFSGPSLSYGNWIYNYLCNQCLSFHHLCCEFEFWFSSDTPVSATNKTDLHDITEILMKVPFNTMTIILTIFSFFKTTSTNSSYWISRDLIYDNQW